MSARRTREVGSRTRVGHYFARISAKEINPGEVGASVSSTATALAEKLEAIVGRKARTTMRG